MPNKQGESVFQLIKSLEKSEKRNFKLYVRRNSALSNLKVIQLFDAMDKMQDYDEKALLRKHPQFIKSQLSNLKAHLYKLILSSLRLIKQEEHISLFLSEQIDFAQILYQKGLYQQSLKILDKAKEVAVNFHQINSLQQILDFEKKIEGLYITRNIQDRADQLTSESAKNKQQLSLASQLSDLALQLYSWYMKNGVARNSEDLTEVKTFFEDRLPSLPILTNGFYELLYLYQSYAWYALIRQDFLQHYRYSKKWVDLFVQFPNMMEAETAHYIKGMHNQMTAHFHFRQSDQLKICITDFEVFSNRKIIRTNENYSILCFQYLYLAKINLHFIEGSFSEGLKLIPHLKQKLNEHDLLLDRHRVLVFYYKIACLYFGSRNFEKAIDYLGKIINQKTDLRSDLQCYARLLHLISHYELGNFNLIEYLIRSVYRYMAKMQNLSGVEESMFHFLRQSFSLHKEEITPAFEQLLNKIRQQEYNRFENRAFLYLDIISWLESKIASVDVQTIIKSKFQKLSINH
jgi:hypothetical protein